MINIADMPAVRAQIEQLTRDIAEGKMQVGAGASHKKSGAAAAEQASYPARNLVFEDGRYQVASREK
jgi:hypothetical protein